MIIYFSGEGFKWANPEILLGTEANVMHTFAKNRKKPDGRFRAMVQARKKARKAKRDGGNGLEDNNRD